MKKRTLYFTCVASYLTGWVVAHATYNRLRKYMLTEQTDEAGDTFAEQVAARVAELLLVTVPPSTEGVRDPETGLARIAPSRPETRL